MPTSRPPSLVKTAVFCRKVPISALIQPSLRAPDKWILTTESSRFTLTPFLVSLYWKPGFSAETWTFFLSGPGNYKHWDKPHWVCYLRRPPLFLSRHFSEVKKGKQKNGKMELSQERSSKRPLNPRKAGQRKKPSTAEAMKKGAEIPVSNLDRKEPAPGDNATNAFITWSAPRTGGRWRKPASVTRKEFAVILGQCWEEILDIVAADPGNEEDPPAPEIAVFKESHKDGGTHYHAILDVPPHHLVAPPPRSPARSTTRVRRENRGGGRREALGQHAEILHGAYGGKVRCGPHPVFLSRFSRSALRP